MGRATAFILETTERGLMVATFVLLSPAFLLGLLVLGLRWIARRTTR